MGTAPPNPREGWDQQLQVYAAHGPTDHSNGSRYYVVAVMVVVGLFAILFVLAALVPSEAPPPTTDPPLTFPTVGP